MIWEKIVQVIVMGRLALVCAAVSVICMIFSKWRAAVVLSVAAVVLGFVWVGSNYVLMALLLAYPVLVGCIAFFVDSRKKKKEQAEQTDLKGADENDRTNE